MEAECHACHRGFEAECVIIEAACHLSSDLVPVDLNVNLLR